MKHRLIRFLLMCAIAFVLQWIVRKFGWHAGLAAWITSSLGYLVGGFDKTHSA